MKKKFTILGCGSSLGAPWITNYKGSLKKNSKNIRTRCCAHIQYGNSSILIDTSPDIKHQFLRNKLKTLDAIVYTHEHADHSAGMDDIRPFFFRQGAVPMYGSQRVMDNFTQRFNYIFSNENKYPGAPSVDVHRISSKHSFDFKGKKITPVEVLHDQLPVLGYRIDDFCYLTDVKTISDQEQEKLKGLDVLVLNCLRKEVHPSHLNLEEALHLIEKLKPKRSYLTHISHLMGFHEEVSTELPPNVFLAYDTLSLSST